MKILKEKLIISIFLVVLTLIYICVTRGNWATNIEQQNSSSETKNKIKLNEFLSIESEYFGSSDLKTIGSNTYFVAKKCFEIDSLSISISAIKNGNEIFLNNSKSKIADRNNIEFDSYGNVKETSYFRNWKIEVCPYNEIEISNWFETKNIDTNKFIITYFIKTKKNEFIKGKSHLVRKTNFEIQGKHHYDFIILLYPILWGILLILIIFGIIKKVRKKRTPNTV
jgi:hypothetical protein